MIAEEVKYDAHGRMVYHPDYHPNHGKEFTAEELVYLCKFNEIDGPKHMSLALGKTEMTVANKVTELRQNGLYQIFKDMPEETWLILLRKAGLA